VKSDGTAVPPSSLITFTTTVSVAAPPKIGGGGGGSGGSVPLSTFVITHVSVSPGATDDRLQSGEYVVV
jgi:hypothetical protein